MQEEARNWSIGQLAEYSRLSVKTIRFYSDQGLLASHRSVAGHRRFGPGDLARLTLIRALRSLDVGLDTIGQLLAGVTDLPQILAAHEHVLELRLRTVRRQLAVCRASAQGRADVHGKRLQVLTRIEDAERDQLLQRFWDRALIAPAEPSAMPMRFVGTPELPEEPTAAQVDAWLELTELAADADFALSVRGSATWFADNAGPGSDPVGWRTELDALCDLAESLISDGVEPADERALPAAEAYAAGYARAMNRSDGPAFRRWLAEQLQRATDPRAARWWTLAAVIQPPPTGSPEQSRSATHHRRAQHIAWLNAALHASNEQVGDNGKDQPVEPALAVR